MNNYVTNELRKKEQIRLIMEKHIGCTNIHYTVSVLTYINMTVTIKGKERKLCSLCRPVNQDNWLLTSIYSQPMTAKVVSIIADILSDLNKENV